MTRAEKLIQIAENTPKVYEAGKSDGYTEGYEEGFTLGKAEGGDSETLSKLIDGSLTELYIPTGTTKIKDFAFYSDKNLVKVNMPNTVTSIGIDAFSGCDKIDLYDFSSSKSVPKISSTSSIAVNSNTKILVPSALYDEWITTTNWSAYKDYIEIFDAKSAPNQDNFSIYVDARTLKEIVDYNVLGFTLASGVGKSELHYEGEVPYLRLYGDGVSSEACARLKNIEDKPTGKYLVFAYRLPTTNVETYTGMQVFATTDGTDITGAGDMFYMTAEKDGKWHVGVIDIEEAIKSSKWVASGQFICKFNPNSDGTYTISRLRLDWFNKVTTVDSYIDVAYVGICDTLDKAISADPDYTGREFNADYFVNALETSAVKNNYNGMSYVTLSHIIPSNGEVRHYLYDGGEESMLLGASHYIGVLYRNAPEQYCEFHANSSKDLTDSRWYSTQYIMYEQGSEWKFMVFSLPKLADTVCRKLRIDYFNKLTAGAQKSIDIAFVKFFGNAEEANNYYQQYKVKYNI